MSKQKRYAHEIDVKFGGVSIGDESASIGIAFERNGRELDEIDEMLCGKRLDVFGTIGDHNQDQLQLPGVEGPTRPHVIGTCDSARFAVKPKEFTARLKFSLAEIEVSEMAGLAKQSGTLQLNVLGELDDSDEEPEEPQTKRATKSKPVESNGSPDTVTTINVLIKHGITKKQAEMLRNSELEIKTVEKLEQVMASDEWWHRRVKGLGVHKIDQVTDALLSYRKTNPVAEDD